MLKNKNILICVTGSIAAYKACEVIRLLRKEDVNVQVMMTRSAQKFVGKATFAALTNNEVISLIMKLSPKFFPIRPKQDLNILKWPWNWMPLW